MTSDPVISVKVDFSDLIKKLDKYFPKIQGEIMPAMEEGADLTLIPEAMKRTHIGETGFEKSAWRSKTKGNTLLVGNVAPYWRFTEYGTGIYNLFGNGRKTPWVWYSRTNRWGGVFVKGKGWRHWTKGQKPQRILPAMWESKKDTFKAYVKVALLRRLAAK